MTTTKKDGIGLRRRLVTLGLGLSPGDLRIGVGLHPVRVSHILAGAGSRPTRQQSSPGSRHDGCGSCSRNDLTLLGAPTVWSLIGHGAPPGPPAPRSLSLHWPGSGRTSVGTQTMGNTSHWAGSCGPCSSTRSYNHRGSFTIRPTCSRHPGSRPRFYNHSGRITIQPTCPGNGGQRTGSAFPGCCIASLPPDPPNSRQRLPRPGRSGRDERVSQQAPRSG